MKLFLAGGAVRNLLLGVGSADHDIVFAASPEDWLARNPDARPVGRDVAVYLLHGREHMPLAGTIAEDLAKRDLTINALLMDEDGVIHALPRTFADLAAGRIRHASPSSLADDPVRIFRAARFAASLGFVVVPETVDLMRAVAAGAAFPLIAAERIGREVVKAMGGQEPARFLRCLAEADALSPWFSPLDSARAIPAGPPEHHGQASVFDHTCGVIERTNVLAGEYGLADEDRALANWMALCHDLGKTLTDPALLPRHVGHEKVGAALAGDLADRLRLPARWKQTGQLAARLHTQGGRYSSLREGTRVDLLQKLTPPGLVTPFSMLAMADSRDSTLAETMARDLETLKPVSLPLEWRNRGAESGRKLRDLRAQALADSRKK